MPMNTDKETKAKAKIFMHGRSQAVRLPKEFRFEGAEVHISRMGEKIVLEPIATPAFDVKAWRARLDAFLDTPFPDAVAEAPLEPDEDIALD